MPINKVTKISISKKEGDAMCSSEIYVEERIFDEEEVRKMAERASKRMQASRDMQLLNAIQTNNIEYLSMEMKNVSTYELIKMLIKKLKE